MVVIINKTCDDCEDACDVVLGIRPPVLQEDPQRFASRSEFAESAGHPKHLGFFCVAIVAVLRK